MHSYIPDKMYPIVVTLAVLVIALGQPPPAQSQILGQALNALIPSPTSSSYQYQQREVLDQGRGFVVDWEANRNTNSIVFNISAQVQNGYIAFGLSMRGQVEGADIAILTGIGSAAPTLTDMHGLTNNTIARDAQQDWRLIRAQTANGVTTFSISRNFDTCDQQDIIINNDLRHIIWRLGNTATVPSTFTPEGDTRVYLVDPFVRPSPQALQTWRISRRYRIPPRRTSYWCSIHKGLEFSQKQHIVGFQAYLQDDLAKKHIHHQLAYRCITPPLVDPELIFEKYINHPGEECYLEDSHELPTVFCTEIVHIFGVGGHPFKLPEDIGIAIGEKRHEYFMLETHYDNPDLASDIVVENGVDLHYTSQLRPKEGGLIINGYGIMGMGVLPPRTTGFRMMGQCSPECTRDILPATGVNVVATMLHAHMTTHSVHFKHYRGNTERPWIQTDDNYDYSFQQIRLIPQPVTVLPGDRISVECIMDSNSRNRTTLTGFSTLDEMCITFVVIDKKLPVLYCSSEYPTERALARYGVQNVTWDRELQERVVNDATNPSNEDRTLQQVIDNNYEWTPERKADLQREQLFGEHYATCPPTTKLIMTAYLGLFVDRLTLGLTDAEEALDNARPSTRIVTTPGSTNETMTRYPTGATVYRPPPRPCM